jgi:hypothetical protein
VLLLTLAGLAHYVDDSFWERVLALLCAIVVARLASALDFNRFMFDAQKQLARIISPITAIIFKWIVIGKYKPGKYPIWSGYYLRYWIVNQSLRVAGRGIFSMHPSLEIIYYRLLGARIGKNVRIDSQARLGEFDLLTFRDGCIVDSALVRGFCVEREGYFTLDRIDIGRNAVINTYTQLSPGTVIPSSTVYGPHASSRDIPSPAGFAASNRTLIFEPRLMLKIFVAWPVISLVYFASCELYSLLSHLTNKYLTISRRSVVRDCLPDD